MLINLQNHVNATTQNKNKTCHKRDTTTRVLCSNSQAHIQVMNLKKMGLSLQAIAAITGFSEKEIIHFR
ncbi:hypothetical protein ACF2G4_20395 (plasmid) [Pantoea sp. C3]|jgi:hypothetical protein|uniref:hypothetical protein n=1 Tax=Pantoea phytostimulans TaxID=2769024 RepID=UPI0038F6A391